ncbi:MAG: hypothetical protein AAFR77_05015 [Cyanobacteria bacterium J06631_2]
MRIPIYYCADKNRKTNSTTNIKLSISFAPHASLREINLAIAIHASITA